MGGVGGEAPCGASGQLTSAPFGFPFPVAIPTCRCSDEHNQSLHTTPRDGHRALTAAAAQSLPPLGVRPLQLLPALGQ